MAEQQKSQRRSRWRNPAMFILHYDLPFNFDFGWEEYDALYHDPDQHFAAMKGSSDPCQWPDDHKAQVNAQRDRWMKLYDDWCAVEIE